MKKTILTLICLVVLTGCDDDKKPTSASGVGQARTKVQTNASGHSTEQENIIERLKRDNTPGSIKYLYVISPFSGDVLIYSTVKGKVSSSGKRLTPTTATTYSGLRSSYAGTCSEINGTNYYSEEMIQDDGTYGSSAEYVYWFDQKGVYHQHLVSGAAILHISDQPLKVGKVIINLEQTHEN
jgi:uncharacterized protein YcfL